MLSVDTVSKTYDVNGKKVVALEDISFRMEQPDILGVMGRSGSGKTTLLKIIAGLLSPSTGSVELDGETVTFPTRKIGIVFQDYVTFPWLTVEKNIDFGLKINGITKKESAMIIEQMLEVTGLAEFARTYPNRLSGGQRQRLAIARALAIRPEALLMDEPFGALDEEAKDQLLTFIKSLWLAKPFYMVIVTHDKHDAERLCSKIITLR